MRFDTAFFSAAVMGRRFLSGLTSGSLASPCGVDPRGRGGAPPASQALRPRSPVQVRGRPAIKRRYCAAVAGGSTARSRVVSRWWTRANPCSTLRKRSSVPVEPVLEAGLSVELGLDLACGRRDRVPPPAVREHSPHPE